MNKINLTTLGELKRTSNPMQVRFCCPYCGEDKFRLYVHLKKGVYHCQKCKASGRVDSLETSTLDTFKEKVKFFLTGETPCEKKLSLPDHYIFPVSEKDGLPWKYLTRRGISSHEIHKYSIGYCEEGFYKERIIIPIFDSGKLVYFVARTFTNLEPKYLNVGIKRIDVLFMTFRGMQDMVVIVEGVFDAIRVGQSYPSIALLGKLITEPQAKKISKIAKRALVILDRDAHTYCWNAGKILGHYLPTRVHLLERSKDPGDLNQLQLNQIIKETWNEDL